MISVIFYAWYTREQFYPTILFLVTSKVSYVSAGNLVLALSVLLGRILIGIFFGNLRDVEVEVLYDKAKYSITETCLALTVFRHELTPPVILLFGSLVFVKGFHWLAKSRIEYNENILPLPWSTHIRIQLLLISIGAIDLMTAAYCIDYTLENGKSVMILFGFEFGLLFIDVANLYFKYFLQCVESSLESGFQSRFQSKGLFSMFGDLVAYGFRFITYVCFFCLVFVYYGLPIHIVREVWVSFLSFQQKMASCMRYMELTKNLDQRFDDANEEELAAAGDCLICREAILQGKKLPCGHIFHLDCLRLWLQHQQSCPLCRADIPSGALSATAQREQAAARAQRAVERARAADNAADNAANNPNVAGVLGGVDEGRIDAGRGRGRDGVGGAAGRPEESMHLAAESLRDGGAGGVGGSGFTRVPVETDSASTTIAATPMLTAGTKPTSGSSAGTAGGTAVPALAIPAGASVGTSETAAHPSQGALTRQNSTVTVPAPLAFPTTQPPASPTRTSHTFRHASLATSTTSAAVSQDGHTDGAIMNEIHFAFEPSFFLVKSRVGAVVYASPELNAQTLRSLRLGLLVLVLERTVVSDGSTWLRVPDGWVLESGGKLALNAALAVHAAAAAAAASTAAAVAAGADDIGCGVSNRATLSESDIASAPESNPADYYLDLDRTELEMEPYLEVFNVPEATITTSSAAVEEGAEAGVVRAATLRRMPDAHRRLLPEVITG